ncbi:ArsR/SmtB family transcription factor [Pseudonocardia sp. TMWB2A]|uniref:ArsR/SmtB family transcription factor n=1 Tax=Pseudonocardia sp. TMWB2A TaxID=687430 RepID=UPI00307F9C83
MSTSLSELSRQLLKTRELIDALHDEMNSHQDLSEAERVALENSPDQGAGTPYSLDKSSIENSLVIVTVTMNGYHEKLPTKSSREIESLIGNNAVEQLDALSHPARLAILGAIVGGATTTKELSEQDFLPTTGKLHHHLRHLISSGWIDNLQRGRYTVPRERLAKLFAILLLVQ